MPQTQIKIKGRRGIDKKNSNNWEENEEKKLVKNMPPKLSETGKKSKRSKDIGKLEGREKKTSF